jgi:hypothetical protein
MLDAGCLMLDAGCLGRKEGGIEDEYEDEDEDE